MRLSALAVIILAAAFGPSAAELQVQRVTTSGAPNCSTCDIVLRKVFTLSDVGDSTAIETRHAPVHDSRGRFFFQSAQGMNGVMVFDSTGRFLSRLGRLGSGPGEFGGLGFSTIVGRGDTIFVCGATKCQVFSPALKYVRSFSTVPGSARPAAVVMSNGDIAFRMWSENSALSRNPIHLFTTEGRLVRSFGTEVPFPPNCGRCVGNAGLGLSLNKSNVWIAQAGRYELNLWDSDGKLLRQIRVQNSPWYTPSDPANLQAVPMSSITRLIEDPSGILFVFGTAAKQIGPATLPPGANVSRQTAVSTPMNVARTPQVEAIDVKTGAVLASRAIPGFVASTYGGDYLTSSRDGGGSIQYIDVWKVQLLRR